MAMSRIFRPCAAAVLTVIAAAPVTAQAVGGAEEWVTIDPEQTLYVEIPRGRIVIALSSELAQGHVAQVKELARRGHYDGLRFYRVASHVAQGGSYGWDRSGVRAPRLAAEFDEPWSDSYSFTAIDEPDRYGEQPGFIDGLPVKRSLLEDRVWITGCTGVVTLARGEGANTAAAELTISQQPTQYNDRNVTNFGRVVWGMELVATMPRATADDESTWTPIITVRVASDLPREERTPLEWMNTRSPTFLEAVERARNGSNPWYVNTPLRWGVCDPLVDVRLAEEADLGGRASGR